MNRLFTSEDGPQRTSIPNHDEIVPSVIEYRKVLEQALGPKDLAFSIAMNDGAAGPQMICLGCGKVYDYITHSDPYCINPDCWRYKARKLTKPKEADETTP